MIIINLFLSPTQNKSMQLLTIVPKEEMIVLQLVLFAPTLVRERTAAPAPPIILERGPFAIV